MIVASDRQLRSAVLPSGVEVHAIELAPEIAQHFRGGAHAAELVANQCACDLADDPSSRRPRAGDREERRHNLYAAIGAWARPQVEDRHRPLWFYLCWDSDIDKPHLGTVTWSLEQITDVGSAFPERTIVELLPGKA